MRTVDARIARHTSSLGRAGYTTEVVGIADVHTRRAQVDVIKGVEELARNCSCCDSMNRKFLVADASPGSAQANELGAAEPSQTPGLR